MESDEQCMSDLQIKEELADGDYDQKSVGDVVNDQNFLTDTRNSSPMVGAQASPGHSQDDLVHSVAGCSAAHVPTSDQFAGSTVRSQLHGTVPGNKTDSIQSIVENLLKKNETVLAMSDTGGLRPNARRVKAAHDGVIKRSEPAFPSSGNGSFFPVSHSLIGHVDKITTDKSRYRMIRPRSPTRKYDGILKDKTHFTYALMESDANDGEIEKILSIQNHELVCAVGSKSFVTDKFNRVVASVDFNYFWCNFCPFSTNNKSVLTQHVLEHRFCCKHCPYESFCRSDVVRHMHKMHKEFKKTADHLFYCTILSDYLRVKCRHYGKENKDPDEDVEPVDENQIESALQQLSSHKRKAEAKDMSDSTAKKSKGDEGMGTPEMRLLPEVESHTDSQKCFIPRPGPDYDIFEMEVEEFAEGQQNSTSNEEFKGAKHPTGSGDCPDTTVDKHLITAKMVQGVPRIVVSGKVPTAAVTTAASRAKTSVSDQPPILSAPIRRGSGRVFKNSSSLYWSCGYCTFQSSGQAEIKEHSSQEHKGKPHRYIALIRNSNCDLLKSNNKNKEVNNSSNKTEEVNISTNEKEEVNTSTSKNKEGTKFIRKTEEVSRYLNDKSQTTSTSSPSPSVSETASSPAYSSNSIAEDEREDIKTEAEPSSKTEAEPSSKTEAEPSSKKLKVKVSSSKASSNKIVIYNCNHCSYTSKRHWTLKSHVYYKHRGEAIIATIGSESSSAQMFFCARDDCNFRSENGLAFLKHVDECTPWNNPQSSDVEVEPHIRQCLELTVSAAKMSATAVKFKTKNRKQKS